jgi:hypothetical protein
MAKNKIQDLRDHLFEELERLRDAKPEEIKGEIERAKAFTGVSNAIIATAKVEIDMVKAVSGTPETDFIRIAPESRDLPKRLFGTAPKRLNGVDERNKPIPH